MERKTREADQKNNCRVTDAEGKGSRFCFCSFFKAEKTSTKQKIFLVSKDS